MTEASAEKRALIDRTTWVRFVRAIKNFATSEVGGRGALLFGALLAFLLVINALNVLNSYVGRDFMTSIERRSMPDFVREAFRYIGVFGLSTFAAITFRFTEERLGLLWRGWLTGRSIDRYLEDRSYQRLRTRADVGNPDQRIADDTRTFVTMTLSFVLLLLNAIFTIIAFSGVLFSISPLLWLVAVGYALLGSLAAIGLGRPLVRMNYDQSDRDASLRAELVHVRENADSIAITHGESPLHTRLHQRLDAVVANLKHIIRVNRNLGYFTTGYNYMVQIIPALVVGPLFIRGHVEFGVISQSAMAFTHLLGAFSLIVTQFQSISSYAAVLARLSSLVEALDTLGESEPSLVRTVETRGRFAYENLSLRSPADGRPLVSALSLSISPGTRLLVVSEEEAPAAALFQASAGLWREGEGIVIRPPASSVVFVPARPYLVPGTLRDLLSVDSSGGEDLLGDFGIEGVAARAGGLDVERDWVNLLGLSEQQLLVLSRVALARPEFAFLFRIDTTLRAAETIRALRALKARSITCVTFSDSDTLRDEHDRVLRLDASGSWTVT